MGVAVALAAAAEVVAAGVVALPAVTVPVVAPVALMTPLAVGVSLDDAWARAAPFLEKRKLLIIS